MFNLECQAPFLFQLLTPRRGDSCMKPVCEKKNRFVKHLHASYYRHWNRAQKRIMNPAESLCFPSHHLTGFFFLFKDGLTLNQLELKQNNHSAPLWCCSDLARVLALTHDKSCQNLNAASLTLEEQCSPFLSNANFLRRVTRWHIKQGPLPHLCL